MKRPNHMTHPSMFLLALNSAVRPREQRNSCRVVEAETEACRADTGSGAIWAAIVRRAFRSARVAAFPGGPAPAAPRTEPGTGQAQWAAAGGSPSSGLRRRPSPPGPSEAISSLSGGNGGPQQGHWTSQEQACEGRVWSEVSTGSEATGFEEEEGDSWFYVTCVCGRRQHPRRLAQGFGGRKVRLEDGEAVSSSYESYDEDESSKGKSAPYQWPSPEASIELMRDARICAFLWRKKWLGQWAKQLCVIKDTRLLCYKSSKDHSPQLDVNLLGSSVVHKEKQVRKKEHKLKITPVSADVIVLGLQSKDQAEQWLRVIQEVSGLPSEGACEGSQYTPDAQRPSCPKKTEVRVNLEIPSHWGEKQGLSLKSQHTRFPGQPDVTEKYLSASDYGSSIDGHPEVPETKDVKKKCSAGLKLSNLMNLGRKKSTSLEPPERSLETTSYLNVLVNSQWKSRWCSVRDSHLYFYQDRNRSKAAQQPLSLVGCEVVPDPSPDHLYSFRILHDGEELAKLEAKSSEEMGHWLGLLLSESGSKTDPEEFTYDYVDADRVSCIVSAAKTSLLLMQRKFSEPNTYIDGLPSQHHQELLYDDVEVSELTAVGEAPEEAAPATDAPSEPDSDRVYLDLTPVKSFLHGTGGAQARAPSPTLPQPDPPAEALPADLNPTPDEPLMVSPENPELQVQGAPQQVSWPHLLGCLGQLGPVCFLPKQMQQESQEPEEPSLGITAVKIQTEQQKISFPPSCPDTVPITPAGASPPVKDRLKATNAEIKLGKNRTEAEVKRYTEEKERLEKKKEEIRGHLAQLRREKRELKETLLKCTADWLLSADKGAAASLEEKLKEIDEECRVEECRRVDLELSIVEVKDSLKKAEAGPVTLGTTVDTTHLENVSPRPKAATSTPAPDCTPVNSATALKNRPLSVMVTGKGTVLQKAKLLLGICRLATEDN
ncbi:actin filament-associated protein 1-like 2 isoform X15 [Tursiops truncatus]|uniref:actin filament-associated protein 1-like 2 isoform X15 n=1 Tax=Tursiops truncatus TaxID=9739 RepID=UPI003CCFCB5C